MGSHKLQMCKKCQGTTSVVPKYVKKEGALAPEETEIHLKERGR
jgi:hypothetical protein